MIHVALLGVCGLVFQAVEYRPEVARAADRAQLAYENRDEATLNRIARLRTPDPWVVADLLAGRGWSAAAEALARATPSSVRAPLLQYLAALTEEGETGPREDPWPFPSAQETEAILEACAYLDEFSNPVLRHRIAFEAGLDRKRARDWETSFAHFQRATMEARELGWLAGEARAVRETGSFAHLLPGGLECAAETWSRAAQLDGLLEDRPNQAMSLLSLGNACAELGRFGRASDILIQARGLFQELQDGKRELWTLLSLGLVALRSGNPVAALQIFTEAEELATRGQHLALRGEVHLGLAETHGQLGNMERAVELSRQALGFFEGGGSRFRRADALGALGLAELRRGGHDEAVVHLRKALILYEEDGHKDREFVALTNLGLAKMFLNLLEEAEAYQERALKLAHQRNDRWLEASAHFHLGRILRRAGRYEDAAESDEMLLRIGREFESERLLMRGNLNATKRLLAEGRNDEALVTSRRAMEHTRRIVTGLEPKEDAVARDHRSEVFEVAVRAALASEDPEALLWNLEAGRAQSLLESLGGRERLEPVLVSSQLVRERRQAEAEEREALRLFRRAPTDSEDAKRARKALGAARERGQQALGKIQEASTAGDVLFTDPVSLAELREVLRPDEAVVLYALLEPEATALVLTVDAARIVPLGPTEEIEVRCGLVRSVSGRLRGVAVHSSTTDEPSDDVYAHLRELLIEPLGLESPIRRILLSPHGPLAYVPFVLVAPEHEMVFLPSASAYRLLATRGRSGGSDVLGVGVSSYETHGLAPLPGARAEVTAIGDHLLLDESATEEGLATAFARSDPWRAIHLACHASVDPDDPLANELSLTPSEKNDGRMTVHEVFGLTLKTDLVVLSGCETGVGTLYRTEGVLGFTRAFMGAGARQVIVSLWRVDDQSTRVLMERLYELWNPENGDGVPLATALREAQAHVRAQPGWEAPEFWAAWQLWGLPD